MLESPVVGIHGAATADEGTMNVVDGRDNFDNANCGCGVKQDKRDIM